MKTKFIHISERARSITNLWKDLPESEKFHLRLELIGSQEEIEKVRDAIFNLDKEASQ